MTKMSDEEKAERARQRREAEMERIRELGRGEGARLLMREHPITEEQQRKLRILLRGIAFDPDTQ